MRILVVEDDEFIAKALAMVLSELHYAVEVARDGEAGWELIQAYNYDLILLDVMLPKLDGISLCQRLRSRGYTMPILLLTGRDSSHEKAMGLDAGADDYLVKPFDQEELVARVRALLRRGNAIASSVLEWRELRLDPTSCEVTYGTHLLHLTPKEYALLELFLRNHRRVYSCSAILDHIWSYDKTPGEEAVRTQIKGLRQKLKAAGAPSDLIETVYGIGYRLKSLAAKPTLLTPPEHSEPTRQQTLTALAGVWEQFKGRVSEQVALLEQVAIQLTQNSLQQELRSQAEQAAHTLAGSLGTFGLIEGSRLAREIEYSLQDGKLLSHHQTGYLRELVVTLRQAVEQTPVELAVAAQATKDERPLLLIVERDRQLAQQLTLEAANRGIRAEVAINLAAARAAISQAHPQIVLLELSVSEAIQESLKLLADLSKQTPSVPVVVFTAQASLTERLEVARLGGTVIFVEALAASASGRGSGGGITKADRNAAVKVMVVDDDPQILATLQALLEPGGLKVTTLKDPRYFWETLAAVAPDLLILDIKMPHMSGIELCQVVRNDPCWGALPILVLTAHTDAQTLNQVFAVGADDFVSKPIIGPELISRIINRLERIKLLRSLAEIDPLTKVYNREKSTQELEKFLHLAQKYHQPLCLAIIDLDRFKQINNLFGHATGDAVLRQLGKLLQQSFPSEDVVSRWGGEEFVVGMYGMTKIEGWQRLKIVQVTLMQQKFTTSNDTKLQIAFSAGLAEYPEDGTDLSSLYRWASIALAQAKVEGGDRIMGNEHGMPLRRGVR